MRRLVVLASLVLALGACTSDDDSNPYDSDTLGGSESESGEGGGEGSSSDEAAPKGPDCSDIWKTGETLPEDFEGCIVDGREATIDTFECTDGSRLIVAEDLMFARTGGEIFKPDVSPLQDTEEYGKAYAECTGE